MASNLQRICLHSIIQCHGEIPELALNELNQALEAGSVRMMLAMMGQELCEKQGFCR